MANKFVYVAVIHQTRVTFPCGIVSDLSANIDVGVTHSKQNKFWY